MGLHMVAVAKYHLQVASHGLSPAVVAGIVCPLALKLFMGLRMFRKEAIYSARLFFFRLGQIAFNGEIPFANGTRVERALRLIGQTVSSFTSTSTTTPSELEDSDTFNILSMLSL